MRQKDMKQREKGSALICLLGRKKKRFMLEQQ